MLCEDSVPGCRDKAATRCTHGRRSRCFSWQCSRLWLFLGGFFSAAAFLSHSLAGSAESTAGNDAAPAPAIVVNLEYKELTNGYVSFSSVTADSLPDRLKLQPDVEKHDLGRFSVRFKDGPPMAVVWDRTSNVLYLDLNRNLDLTDDPAGVFTNEFSNAAYGSFKNVRITVPTKEAEQPFLVDLNLFPLPTVSRLHGSIHVRSFWHGKVTLGGADYEIGIIDQPGEKSGPIELLLRSWEQRGQPLTPSEGDPAVFVLPDELFCRGHLYVLSHRFDTNASPVQWRIEFRESPVQLGEVSVTGKHVDRIVMTGQRRTVVLDQPKPIERVPVGDYMLGNVSLRSDGRRAVLSRRPQDLAKLETVKVQNIGQAILVCGGPLTNSVSIVRRGKTLVFNYRLRGEGGMEYRLIGLDEEMAQPEFAVYDGDRKIASGKFEFG